MRQVLLLVMTLFLCVHFVSVLFIKNVMATSVGYLGKPRSLILPTLLASVLVYFSRHRFLLLHWHAHPSRQVRHIAPCAGIDADADIVSGGARGDWAGKLQRIFCVKMIWAGNLVSVLGRDCGLRSKEEVFASA